MRSLWKHRAGSISIYAAMFSVVAMGGGALVIDYSRAAVLHNEMQNAADAAAMSGAFHLDGKDGARTRATSVALNALRNSSGIPEGNGTTDLSADPAAIKFYSQVTPNLIDATTDLDAKFIEVGLTTQNVSYMFAPILNVISTGTAAGTTVQRSATAQTSPYICHAPPLMMCDLAELDPALDPTLKANIGRQIRLKEPQAGGGSWAPGNFGLLALPDGSSGAVDIEAALAAEEPADCYRLDVITATGSKTNKVKDGINARFDIGTFTDPPAPNVINYPLDADLIADSAGVIGNANWNIENYWLAKHGSAAPPALANASRYQVYLYELGETYARDGKETLYPIPSDGVPDGFNTVTPGAADIPVDPANPTLPDFDGVPQNTPSVQGPARRLVKVALLQCIADGVNGKGTYPTHGRFVEMLITQEVKDPPDAAIYGEIVRALSPLNEPEFHANVKLVK